MHELSVALSIIEGAEEESLRQGGGAVCAVHIKLGPLAGVVEEALRFSYGLACEGTRLEGSSLLIEHIPLRIYCCNCRADKSPISMQRLECADCGFPADRVTQGDELEVTALELHA